MLLNNEHKFIFVHIPKNSGTALSKHVHYKYPKSKLLMGVDHDTGIDRMHLYCDVFDKYVKKYVNDDYKKYIRFCIIRNPYNKLYSAWRSFSYKYGYKNINDFIKYKLTKEHIYDDDNRNGNAKAHYRPQYTYICDSNNQITIDYILFYESLNRDIAEFNVLTGLDIPRYANTNVNKSYLANYNAESISKINVLYKRDFELFGYKMLDPNKF